MDAQIKLSRRQAETLDFILAEVAAGRAVPGQAKVRERFGLSSFGAGGYRLSALVKAGALEHAAKGEHVLTDAGRSWAAPATPTKPWPMPNPAESVRWAAGSARPPYKKRTLSAEVERLRGQVNRVSVWMEEMAALAEDPTRWDELAAAVRSAVHAV